jgi:hypothetical protein
MAEPYVADVSERLLELVAGSSSFTSNSTAA